MKVKHPYLNELAGPHEKILVFDCEFWHVYDSKGFIPSKAARNEFYLPREIGGFVLTKSADGHWLLKNPFFVTLSPPKKRDVSFVSSHFSSVTEPTRKRMDEYQSMLSSPNESAFLATLPKELHEVLLEDIHVYLNDKNIKSAHKPHSWLKSFMEQYRDSVVIVKGTLDMDAIKNACIAYDIPYKPPRRIIDIAEWNPESHQLCGTAKLEGTFECIQDELSPETKSLLRILPLRRAHDPRTDASMTLIVALYIIQKE
jgi:hypothetical protein